MKPGYVYVLTNESMPGIVKVGRTERQPEIRSKELQTTGVPQPFRLEHFVFVDDCPTAEQQIHTLLESKGLRTSASREFFNATLQEVIEAVELVTCQRSSTEPDFRYQQELASLAAAVPTPTGNKAIDRDEAEKITERLAKIARRGYPLGMKRCAEIFEINSPSTPRFKHYWREFLELARAESIRHNIASGGRLSRMAVGKETAEYIARCHSRGWLQDDDFSFVSDFLVSGDQFQYEGYIDQIRRYNFPESIRERAESA
nr:GIY-YIG nuclease family protein [uncultured Rhodoferax sp.]